MKFIEDDFLGGQRLDPKTDGRPDPRPDVRENAPQLGDLALDFDFSQAPRPSLLLSVHPLTELTAPSPAAGPARGPLGRPPGRLRSLLIRTAAAYFGMTTQELRIELASGRTLRQIAREHGRTLAGLRRAVLRQIARGFR